MILGIDSIALLLLFILWAVLIILGTIFIIQKIMQKIDWQWRWVFLPLWVALLITLGTIIYFIWGWFRTV